jgi:glycosyltransferase involved in cell wall biosynthesis
LDWLRLPLLAFLCIRLIRRNSIEAIVTLFHGRFYLAAFAAAQLTRTPYIAFVHDDYVSDRRSIWKGALYLATRTVARHAAHIYAVSPAMQEKLRFEFAVQSEVQLPATKAHFKDSTNTNEKDNDSLLIVYAGSITNAVEDSVRMLVEIIMNGTLREYGIPSAKIQLFTSLRPDQVRAWGWDHPDVRLCPWISQTEIPKALSQADILFLPFSFRSDLRHAIEASFPSKTADYVASGRPILVFGPKYSSLVRYATEEGFAEVVDEFNPVVLAHGIHRIASSSVHQKRLATRALEVFSTNHDIERQRSQFQLLVRHIVRNDKKKYAPEKL